MRAVVYSETGPSSVLRLVERPDPAPGAGEVLVRVVRAGVNPTDWKSRVGNGVPMAFDEIAPGQDGAGLVAAVGAGVTDLAVGDRVWFYGAQMGRAVGAAAELTVQPAATVSRLPDGTSFDLGASLGVPALTAHRALTAGEDVTRLAPGAFTGRTVLVAGGAGAVGNAAIQLARWAGATVVTTVSGDEKAALARAAGADHVVNYRTEDVVAAVRAVAPDGVEVVVEVSPARNIGIDLQVVRNRGTVAYYATDGGEEMVVPARESFIRNVRTQGVLLYTVGTDLLAAAADDVDAALAAGALRAGADAGLPLHHFPLERTAAAHDAVEQGTVGKVLVDVGEG